MLVCLTAVVVLVSAGSVHAMAQQSCKSCYAAEGQHVATAYMRETATGRVVKLPVRQMHLQVMEQAGCQNVETQYVVDIPGSLLRASSTTESKTDPSISYRLTLTQYYDEYEDAGFVFASVSRYRGVWRQLDSQVAASDGYLYAGVSGPTPDLTYIHSTQEGRTSRLVAIRLEH